MLRDVVCGTRARHGGHAAKRAEAPDVSPRDAALRGDDDARERAEEQNVRQDPGGGHGDAEVAIQQFGACNLQDQDAGSRGRVSGLVAVLREKSSFTVRLPGDRDVGIVVAERETLVCETEILTAKKWMREKSWNSREAAAPEDLSKLSAVTENMLPEIYLLFLSHSDGGEGPLLVDPYWLVLESAASVADSVIAGTFIEFFLGLLVIGGNGGGEGIAFDCRADHDGKVVFFDMTNADLNESIQPLAGSFSALLDLVEPQVL